jgi:hypothetical protein
LRSAQRRATRSIHIARWIASENGLLGGGFIQMKPLRINLPGNRLYASSP